MKKNFEIIVGGLVQGVGYRNYAVRQANELNVKGFVKNMYDGTVKIVVTAEAGLIDPFVEMLKIGPRRSAVKFVKCQEIISDKEHKDFRIEF